MRQISKKTAEFRLNFIPISINFVQPGKKSGHALKFGVSDFEQSSNPEIDDGLEFTGAATEHLRSPSCPSLRQEMRVCKICGIGRARQELAWHSRGFVSLTVLSAAILTGGPHRSETFSDAPYNDKISKTGCHVIQVSLI